MKATCPRLRSARNILFSTKKDLHTQSCSKNNNNKKDLLRDRKRRTARGVACLSGGGGARTPYSCHWSCLKSYRRGGGGGYPSGAGGNEIPTNGIFLLLLFVTIVTEAIVPQLLRELCSNDMTPRQHLETQQALFKQFAEILDFTLKFDDLKVRKRHVNAEKWIKTNSKLV